MSPFTEPADRNYWLPTGTRIQTDVMLLAENLLATATDIS